jgi:NADPH:quinone reductase-like Zn-dependent oxidoreductase
MFYSIGVKHESSLVSNTKKPFTMKAIVCKRYGSPDTLTMEEVENPTPGEGEVLIKIRAAGLNAADWHVMRGSPYLMRFVFGFKGPKYPILGSDVAGYVEAVGKKVTKFRLGDAVLANLFNDGNSDKGFGAFAEFVSVGADDVVLKPSNITFEEAAAIPLAAVTALQALTKAQTKAGDKLLVNGASGGVGTYTVQIAKSMGCEVTAVCSGSKTEMVRAIGADYVINYEDEDVTKSGNHYDVIVGANGYHPITQYARLLSPRGQYVSVGGSLSQMFESMLFGPFFSKKNGKQIRHLAAKTNSKDLAFVTDLAAAEKIKPVIDKVFGLAEVPDAMRYLEQGHAKGKIVIALD